ncbi:MAG: hypothetical protein K0R65_191 [Crocinitomicaceae bacterium]|jgi:lipopolysaccharide export LptBFGC system permease protein LptF|nr:hypothetical protein [Crocinitomicaceae bacterium]
MKLFLSIALLLFVFPVLAQSSGKIKKYGIVSSTATVVDASGKQKTESIERYDSKGRLVYIEEYNKKGVLKEKAAYTYDKKGLLIEEVKYDDKGEKEEIITIAYDLELPVKYTYSDPKGKLQKTMIVTYNGFREKTQEITSDASGKLVQTSTFEYDNKGLKTKKNTTDASGQVIESKIYTYEFE